MWHIKHATAASSFSWPQYEHFFTVVIGDALRSVSATPASDARNAPVMVSRVCYIWLGGSFIQMYGWNGDVVLGHLVEHHECNGGKRKCQPK